MGRQFPPNPSNKYWTQEEWDELVTILTHRRHRVLDRFREILLKGQDRAFFEVEQDIASIVVPTSFSADCDAGLVVNEFIYIDSLNHVDLAVASAGGNPTVGVIVTKPTATTCTVQTEGRVTGFSGLIPGTEYFLSMVTPGGIVTPANPVGPSGSFNQRVGIALAPDVLQMDLEDTPIYF